MIRPYLRDLINKHKPTAELNNTNNTNDSNTNNSNNSNNNNNTDRAEWKIQLVMQNSFFLDKDPRTICSASKPVEIFMGSDTENAIDTLFNTILDRIQQAIETSNERGSRFTHGSVLYCIIIFRK